MTFNLLEGYLVSQLFAVLVIFTRMGTALMLMPGFGESYIYPRSRLLLALMLAIAMAPFLEPYLPPIPPDPARLAFLLAGEIFIGALIGTVARMLFGILHVAGMIISYQSSLALATQFDTTQASQGSILGNFLNLSALMFIFAVDLHHMLLRGMADSYSLMIPNVFPPMDDIANYLAQLTSYVFMVGFQLSGPILVIGFLLYLAAGILARLMPNMQVFFVIMPLQLIISFFVLMISFHAIITEFATVFSTVFSDFLEGI